MSNASTEIVNGITALAKRIRTIEAQLSNYPPAPNAGVAYLVRDVNVSNGFSWLYPGEIPLISQAEGDHFLQYAASYPAAWTEADAAAETRTNDIYSFWKIMNSGGAPSWKYRRKTAVNLEGITASTWATFQFGPIYWRDFDQGADAFWRFGIYRNNAGVIDENTFVRANLKWNDATNQWDVYGEEKDGTTLHTSTVLTLPTLTPQPIFLRVGVLNLAAKTARTYVSTAPIAGIQKLQLAQNPSVAPTWGDIWMQIQCDATAATTSFIYLGAADYVGNVA